MSFRLTVFRKLRYALVGLWLASLPLAQAAAPLNRIVAVANQDVVLASELQGELELVKSQLAQRGVNLPPDAVLEQQVLERLIMKRLQLAAAERAGIQVDDASLNAAVQQIAAQNNLSLSEFRATLEQEGFHYAQFRDNLRDEIAIRRLHQRQIDNAVSVSPQEIEEFLRSASADGQGAEYHLGHILIATPASGDSQAIAQARAEARSVAEQLRNGADFAKLAAGHSDAQNALEGGSLGWRRADQLPTLFSNTVPGLAVGEVAGPFQSPSGFHIVKLLERRDGERATVTQTKARHILLRPNAVVTDADAQMRLETLRQRIQHGEENFAALARAHSDDKASAAQGGDLGWTTPGSLVPEFQQVMDALAPGEISGPFQSRYGWHIVQVLERRQQDVTEEVRRARAAEAIRQRKADEMLEAWLRRMRDEAYVDVRL